MKAGISQGLGHMLHLPILLQQNLLTRLSLSRINKHSLTFHCVRAGLRRDPPCNESLEPVLIYRVDF